MGHEQCVRKAPHAVAQFVPRRLTVDTAIARANESLAARKFVVCEDSLNSEEVRSKQFPNESLLEEEPYRQHRYLNTQRGINSIRFDLFYFVATSDVAEWSRKAQLLLGSHLEFMEDNCRNIETRPQASRGQGMRSIAVDGRGYA